MLTVTNTHMNVELIVTTMMGVFMLLKTYI